MKLVKPGRLNPGDTVAAVSLSWGGAGDQELLWRYQLGKKRLLEKYGLTLVEMPNTLKGTEYMYNHPEARASDLMEAFKDPSIKGVFSCIGGDDSIRLLPYVDLGTIKGNPKVLLGYSDTTVAHFMCLKAGLSSFYGPSILAEFAENIDIFEYTDISFTKTLFSAEPIGEIKPASEWTGEMLKWTLQNSTKAKQLYHNKGYEFLQGEGKVRGHLIGGCMEVLEMIKGTPIWPAAEVFNGSILFLETSENMPSPKLVTYWLRNYAAQGIFDRASAIIIGKPYQEKFYEEYKKAIMKVTGEAVFQGPIIINMSFGHNEPMVCLPYGALAEIDCDAGTFSILEGAVS